jgi:hypothetical protein
MGWFARGAGNGMISVANQMYKESNAQLESDLMMQRQQMLEEFKLKNMDREQAIKNAPYDRANAAIKTAQGKEVPVDPEEVTSLQGDESAARRGQGGLVGAYQGDTKNIVTDISRIKDDDTKRQAADALEQQLQDAKSRNAGMVEGKTRKLSEDEVMQEARKSLLGDIQAGKALKEGEREKYTKIGKDDTLLDAKGNVVYKNNAGEEQLRAKLENRIELMQLKEDFRREIGVKGSELPSDAKMVNYLVEKGIFPNERAAYDHVKQGKDKDDVAIQASLFSALSKENIGGDPKALWKQAGEMVAGSRGAERGAGQQAPTEQSGSKPWQRKW